ncbi:MAG: invasion associated locus B family protein, partial [Alphaproteobacteria bacterium]|nr:invasion associated locus B family protein [Alphaproteobacteria bacterium]
IIFGDRTVLTHETFSTHLMIHWKKLFVTTVVVTLAASVWPTIGQSQNTAMVMKEFSAWTLHQSRGAAHNICYITATPISKKPEKANRAVIVFYISAWPKDGVRSEVSVKFGYPLDTKKDVSVNVGEENFKLSPRNERAYLYDATKELKLIEAMKKGSKMVVTATSTRGTKTTDTYSLNGISSALKSLAETCQ